MGVMRSFILEVLVDEPTIRIIMDGAPTGRTLDVSITGCYREPISKLIVQHMIEREVGK